MEATTILAQGVKAQLDPPPRASDPKLADLPRFGGRPSSFDSGFFIDDSVKLK
jgi:hypothetical protein